MFSPTISQNFLLPEKTLRSSFPKKIFSLAEQANTDISLAIKMLFRFLVSSYVLVLICS